MSSETRENVGQLNLLHVLKSLDLPRVIIQGEDGDHNKESEANAKGSTRGSSFSAGIPQKSGKGKRSGDENVQTKGKASQAHPKLQWIDNHIFVDDGNSTT
ncbi:hypothetical protein V6N12_000394 [Hibiscus sabdariffa]|uniref:Uncharacterized protein n=1 Tax=Hibiscus sabdariffa TaxID=183260 RepID=A0ABR2BI62_9ROSI